MENLDYLADAVERLGRIDWTNTALGVFTSLAMSIGVSAANGDKFWSLIKEVFSIPMRLLLGGP